MSAPADAREQPAATQHPATAPEPAVRLVDVVAGYDHRPALENIDLEIAAGSLVAIFGPNGGGKSTLLKLIADLIQPRSGPLPGPGATARPRGPPHPARPT